MSAAGGPVASDRATVPAWSRWRQRLCLLGVCLALTFATVYLQWFVLGHDFLEQSQNGRHRRVLLGIAPDPWQYRVLSEWLAHGAIRACRFLGLDRPIVWGFLSMRVAQNLAIFLLAARYFSALGIGYRSVLLGVSGIAWAMTNALYDSDLSLNTYSDVILYLLAGLAVVRRRFIWIVPLSLCAALNRETGALIPALAVAAGLWDRRASDSRQAVWIGAAGALLFAATYLGLRAYLGPRQVFYAHGQPPGLGVVLENLSRLNSWARLIAMGGLFPLFAAMAFRSWPPVLRAVALVVLPVWVVAHLPASVMAESRLFLAPLVLIVIPGGLFAFSDATGARRNAEASR